MTRVGTVLITCLILAVLLAAPLFINEDKGITLNEQDTVLQGCHGVCRNSDAYDPDMPLVQLCDEILKTYTGKGCFAP
jgi:hypothetical protein